jgi:hypothetical protein
MTKETKATCSNCRYFYRRNSDHSEGTCRAYPPKAIFDYRSRQISRIWPPVHKNEWCGHHRSKEMDLSAQFLGE